MLLRYPRPVLRYFGVCINYKILSLVPFNITFPRGFQGVTCWPLATVAVVFRNTGSINVKVVMDVVIGATCYSWFRAEAHPYAAYILSRVHVCWPALPALGQKTETDSRSVICMH